METTTKTIGNYVCKVIVDDCPENPRDVSDNACIMGCFHSRHNLENNTKFPNTPEGLKEFLDFLANNEDRLFKVHLYIYDHSGITISTKPFNDSWDSYFVGFAYVRKDKFLKEFGYDEWNKEAEERATAVINSEVEEYDHYIKGEVYGYEIRKVGEEEVLESCWGFIGDDEQCLKEAEAVAKVLNDEYEKWNREAVESVRNLVIKVTIKHNKDLTPDDVLYECDYLLKSTTEGAIITDTEIMDYTDPYDE